jgi:hypothetical protein
MLKAVAGGAHPLFPYFLGGTVKRFQGNVQSGVANDVEPALDTGQ